MKEKRTVEQKIFYLLAKRARLSEKIRIKYLNIYEEPKNFTIIARKIGRLQWTINRQIMLLRQDHDIRIFAMEENRRQQIISVLEENDDLLKRHIRAMCSFVHGSMGHVNHLS